MVRALFATTSEVGVSLAFRDLGYSVLEKRPLLSRGDPRKKEEGGGEGKGEGGEGRGEVPPPKRNHILQGLNGMVSPGQCCAILGSSGSGKTSLLDLLGGNPTKGKMTGSIYLGGKEVSRAVHREHCAYVVQDDSHLAMLTVAETLRYSALLRLPSNMPSREKEERVEGVLGTLGLLHVRNSPVGGHNVRGISGGERRRVTIAVQLLKDPNVILLDEPTTGLDAFTANNLVALLQTLASLNKTVIFTIHQPRSDIFPLLDQVMLLSQGRCIYFGPCGSLVNYFTSLGFPCDRYANPLDHYIDVITLDRRSPERLERSQLLNKRLVEAYESSPLFSNLLHNIDHQVKNPLSKSLMNSFRNKPSHAYLLYVSTHRLLTNLGRSFSAIWSRSTQLMLFAFLIWIFIFRFGNEQDSVQSRSGFLFESIAAPLSIGSLNAVALFPEIRNLFYRESRDGVTSAPVLVLSYFLSILPTCILAVFLFSGFAYWATGFYPAVDRYFMFTAVVFFTSFFGEMVAVCILGLIYDPNQASGMSSLLFSVSVLLGCGFLRSFENIPGWLVKLSYATLPRYGAEILFTNEFRGLELKCDEGVPCAVSSGTDYVERLFPNGEDNIGRNFGILSAFFVGSILAAILVFSTVKKSVR